MDRIITLYNIEFEVFRFRTSLEKINGLEKYVKNKFINIYNNDDDISSFACFSNHLKTEKYLKAKGSLNHIQFFAVKLVIKF
jgi:L-ribulose-5-phosphate 3-epimerase UlaE